MVFLALGACSGSTSDDDTDGGVLGEAAFEDQFIERYCAEWETCSTGGASCPVSAEDATGTSSGQCDYDAVAAQACLDGVWTCNVDFPGFEFVVIADACLEVCGPAASTSGSGATL